MSLLVVTPSSVATALDEAIESKQFRQITSVLYGVGGRLQYEGYWSGTSAESMLNTRSATKTLVSIAIGLAIDEEFIGSVNDPFIDYVPETLLTAQSSNKAGITIKDLLTMSSALDYDDNDRNSAGNENKMHAHRHWSRFVLELPLNPDYQRDASGNGPFAYCTAGSFLLG